MMKKIAATLTILFMTVNLFASYDEALKLFKEKKYDESLKKLGDELEVSRDMEAGAPNYKIRFLAAHNHWKLGNREAVISHFKRCMDIQKDTVDPYIDLSLFLAEQGLLNDAETYARKGLTVKDSAMLYYVLGKVSLIRQNYWRAKELFEKANSVDPEIYMSYNGLGIALMKLEKYGDANTAFTVALAIRPDSSEILNNMGLSLEKLGKNKEAYEYYKKANSLDMENKVILANMLRAKKLAEK